MEMIYHATTDIQPIVTSPLKRDASVVVEEEIGSRQSHNIHVTDRAKNKAQREPVLIKNRDFSKGLITKRKYPDNTVRTTIYTWWNFVVLNILIQYCTKFSNIYFTVVMIFSVLPGVSPVFPVTSIIPICFIVGVNMLKDGFEDFMRWQADRKVNIKPCILVDETGTEKKITTSAVYAGDIIKVRDGETFPADLVLLSSASKNMCYIETANLDGESNYKQRRALAETAKFVTPESCTKLIGSRITCGPPDNRLYEFEGTFHMPASLKNDLVLNHGVETTDIQEIETTEDFKFPLGKDNILLKGSSLRNTEWVYGVTVYTGHDTKLMKNMKKRKTKRGYVETRLNYLLSGLLLVHQIVCIINVVLYVVYQGITGFNSFYLLPISTRSIDAAFVIYGYCTNFVLFSLMIPMSLFVSLQFVKAIQGGFMTQDKLMEFEGKRMLANATDLNADLSQIEIIFSDKTGTLTNNEMFFRKAAVGKDFLFVKTEHNPDGLAREIIETVDREKLNENERERATYILHYLLCMSLCHLASPKSKHADEDEEVIEPDSPVKPIEKEQIEYQAESPDEIALVLACRDNLFVVNDCTDRFIDLEVFGREHRFFIEAVIEFTPDRKRMSSVLRVPTSFVKQFPWFVKEGTVIGYSKGADSYMFKLLNEGRTEEEQTAFKEQKKFIEKYANEYADEGLRTLVMCVKILEPETATKWITDWKNASVATENRSKRLEEVAATLECELDMIGCSAIEDLLQDYVPETIRFIVAAGIKMWMLTGDKRQTAKNIARTTGLFSEHTVVFDLDGSDRSILNEATIMDTMTKMYDGIITTLETTDDVALIVDGDALNLALHKSCVPVFVKIIGKVRTAICCRATPLHKATLVELMGKKYKMTGLAIGDGANDVPMILKAKVGVGIAGKEGSQAKQASDYCLQRFFHLKRLLFVHGRYSLTRSALFVQYSFYKNLTLTFIQVFFQYYCLYSGQTTVDSWILNLYNLIFTVLPPFVMGLIDKDVNEQVLLENPRLYKQMHKQSILNHWTFGAWILQALYHSVAVFFFTWYVCFYNGLYAYKNDSLWITATMLASVSFVVVNLKALLEYCSFTWIHVACQLISFLSFYIFLFCYSGVPILQGSANMYYIMYNEVMSGNFWLLHLLIIPVCMIPDVSIKLIKKYFFPYESERLQRQYVGLNRKKRNEAKAIALETELEDKSVVNI